MAVLEKLWNKTLVLRGERDPVWSTDHDRLSAGALTLAKGENRDLILRWIEEVSAEVGSHH